MAHIYAVYMRPTSEQNIYTDWKWRVGKKRSKKTDMKKKSGVAILISEKLDLKTKSIKRDKEGHYIILKGVVHQEYITLVNIYASNIGVCWKYTKIYKENLGGLQERHWQQHTHQRGFTFYCQQCTDLSSKESTKIL